MLTLDDYQAHIHLCKAPSATARYAVAAHPSLFWFVHSLMGLLHRTRTTSVTSDSGFDELLAASSCTCPWHPQRPPGPQARDQFASQSTPSLHVERMVDGLVRDLHRLILGEVDLESGGHLLRTPGSRPASVLAATVTATVPVHIGTRHPRPVGGRNHAFESVLHVPAQLVLCSQLRHLRSFRLPVGVPLRGRSAILKSATAGCSIAT